MLQLGILNWKKYEGITIGKFLEIKVLMALVLQIKIIMV